MSVSKSSLKSITINFFKNNTRRCIENVSQQFKRFEKNTVITCYRQSIEKECRQENAGVHQKKASLSPPLECSLLCQNCADGACVEHKSTEQGVAYRKWSSHQSIVFHPFILFHVSSSHGATRRPGSSSYSSGCSS